MKLTKSKNNFKCEECKEKSEEGYLLEVGKSAFRVCKHCLDGIYRLLGKSIVPKSIETAKPSSVKEER